MLVEPRVHQLPADVVVVVAELRQTFRMHLVLGVVELEDLFQLGEAFSLDVDGPVAGAAHGEGFGSEEGGEVDVAGADAQVGGVLADAAALHGGGDHDGREGDAGAIIDAAEDEGLRAAAAGAGHADALPVHIRQVDEEIEGADAVPGLQAHEAVQPHLGFHIGEAAAVRDLQAVGVADHVVMEDDAAHAGERDAACLQRIEGAAEVELGTALDFTLRRLDGSLEEAAIGPVPMGAEHAWHLPFLAARSVQVAAHVVARQTGKIDFFDRVIVPLDLAVNDRLERRLRGHGPDAVGDHDLLAQLLAPLLPGLLAGGHRHREVAVEVLGLAEANIGRDRRGAPGWDRRLPPAARCATLNTTPTTSTARFMMQAPGEDRGSRIEDRGSRTSLRRREALVKKLRIEDRFSSILDPPSSILNPRSSNSPATESARRSV